MPVPAVSVAPLAVLVLAWDEATPTVRTLLEAVQAASSPIGSILMMVPQAEAPGVLSAEEYLPFPATAVAELGAQLAEPSLGATPMAEAAQIPTSDALLPAVAQSEPALVASANAPLASPPTPLIEEVLTPPNLAWPAVRVLHLSSFSLSELAQRAGQPLPAPTWTASLGFPAPPYIGASTLASQPTAAILATAVSEDGLPALLLVSEPAEFAPDLDADLLPTEVDEQSNFELAHATLLPAANALPIDKPASFGVSATTRPALEQASWPEALAALRQPAPLAELVAPTLAAEQDEASGLAQALRAAGRSYSAPSLNFQVIQYARFAVPLALADQSFEAIYAPAWPTWLAAQELRQRTGRPLVLHVTTLAAPASEPLDTATGWEAELQRQALRRADLVLTETTALAHRLCHELALPVAAVRTIAAADVAVIAQALRTVQPRAKISPG